jgi:hypothetical protein
MEIVEYKGYKRNLRVAGKGIEIIATLEVGPRVMHLGVPGGQNLLTVIDSHMGKSGEDTYQFRGGHRLWTAPEGPPCYAIDNAALEAVDLPNGAVRITAPADATFGFQKEIDFSVRQRGRRIRLVHRVINTGTEPQKLAPWALSVMVGGGTAILPLPKRGKHPEDLLPNQVLALWPYTDLADPRIKFGTRSILVAQRPDTPPLKIGVLSVDGWAAYALGETLFVKRFPFNPKKTYPDMGVNCEIWTNSGILELESLGPIVKLAPGRKVEHTEEWELFTGVPPITTEADVDKYVRPLVEGTA